MQSMFGVSRYQWFLCSNWIGPREISNVNTRTDFGSRLAGRVWSV